MSTRATMSMGDGWHLYMEMTDGTIHLEMIYDDVDFEASPGFIDVTIPSEVFKAITEYDADKGGPQ